MLLILIISISFLIFYSLHRHIYLLYSSIGISILLVVPYLLYQIINPGISSAKKEPEEQDKLVCEVEYYRIIIRFVKQLSSCKKLTIVMIVMSVLKVIIITVSHLENA